MAAAAGAAFAVFGGLTSGLAERSAERQQRQNRRRQAAMLRGLMNRERELSYEDLQRELEVARFRRERSIGQSRAAFGSTGARMSSGSTQTALRELERETQREIEMMRERGEQEIMFRQEERQAQIAGMQRGVGGSSARQAGMLLSGFASAFNIMAQSNNTGG